MLSSFSQPVGRIKALSLTVDLRGLVGGVSTGILSAPCRAGRVPCIPIMGKKRSEPRGRQFVEDCAHIQLVLQLMVHSFSPIRAACYYINRQKVLGPRGGGGGRGGGEGESLEFPPGEYLQIIGEYIQE